MSISDLFYGLYSGIMKRSMKNKDSVLGAATVELDAQYAALGITADERAKLRAEVVSRIAVSMASQAAGVASRVSASDATLAYELALIDKETKLLEVQAANVSKESEIVRQEASELKYRGDYMLKYELAKIEKESLLARKQAKAKEQEADLERWRQKYVWEPELKLKRKELSLKESEYKPRLTAERARTIADTELIDAEALKTKEETAYTAADTADNLPAQKRRTVAEKDLLAKRETAEFYVQKNMEHSAMLKAQQAGTAKKEGELALRTGEGYNDKARIERGKAWATAGGMAPEYLDDQGYWGRLKSFISQI